MLALTDPQLAALLGLAGVGLTAFASVLVAVVAKGSARAERTRQAEQVDFRAAYAERGALVEGLSADLTTALARVARVEAREQAVRERERRCRRELRRLRGVPA